MKRALRVDRRRVNPSVVEQSPTMMEREQDVAPCPQCESPMYAVRGSKFAICTNCGFKDSCCY
ncbi:MAG: hypothetical protein HY567_01160 [Candidatus Kerfeldbacteria bacterium]|nr:hypothetical protein [Candidatus Kerfeldbacteria bacterium]